MMRSWFSSDASAGNFAGGYIYPRKIGRFGLLRKRRHLVKLRTALLVSLQNIISRNCGVSFRANEIKRLKEDRVSPLLESNQDLALAGQTSKEMIDQLTVRFIKIEGTVIQRVQLKEAYRYLVTLPGVGKILSLTSCWRRGRSGDLQMWPLCFLLSEGPSRWTTMKDQRKRKPEERNKYLAWHFPRRRVCSAF